MNDNINDAGKEQLSAFVDGEDNTSTDTLVMQLSSDKQTRELWGRYHLIRDVMKDQYSSPSQNLHESVSAALADEPVVLAPKAPMASKAPQTKTLSARVFKQVSGLAIAATIAAVAVIVVRFNPEVQDNQFIAVGPITDKPVRLTMAAEKKLSGYIVNHNEYAVSSKYKSVIPYTTIISYTPGKHVSY